MSDSSASNGKNKRDLLDKLIVQEARLSRARLDNANLSFADLRRVSIDFVDEAANATFDGASMEGAVFKKCAISGARGPVWGGG